MSGMVLECLAKTQVMKGERVRLLDGFRFLAILAVMLVHLTIRWAPPFYPVDVYPYQHFFSLLFAYGGMGVHFFFIISGFVIAFTLERTSDPLAFLGNRFVRLFPAMLLCSVITFILGLTLDDRHFFSFSYSLPNFLPSLTFTSPDLWTAMLHKPFGYISASYWSLWVEVQFYFLAAAIYFSGKEDFLRNLLVVAALLMALSWIPLPDHLQQVTSLFNLTGYIGWFAIGAFFNTLHKREGQTIRPAVMAILALIILSTFYRLDNIGRGIFLLMLCLFGMLVSVPHRLRWLENRLFCRLGVLSYTAYLIHDSNGALLISKYGTFLGRWSPCCVPVMIVLVFIFAECSCRLYEGRAAALLKRAPQYFKARHDRMRWQQNCRC
jgi:peptidoglycan/LPS O-acetylase OafA/YrhL